MKKVIALFLALLLCVSLFGCGSSAEKTEAQPAASSGSAAASSGSSSAGTASAGTETKTEAPAAGGTEETTGTVGYPDDNVDHYARRKYTLCYAMPMETSMHDGYIDGLSKLQERYNFELVTCNANNNPEDFVQNLEIMAAKKVDGFFIDCPAAVMGRVKDLMDELDIPYVAFFSPMTDEDKHMVCPGVINDGFTCGAAETDWFYDHYKEYWGDIDPSEVKMVTLTSSSYVEFAKRSDGARDRFKELFPNSEIQEVDMSGKGVTAEGAYDVITPVITTQPNVKYWFITCSTDGWGQGVARAIEGAKMEDCAIVTCIGNDTLINAWDAGYGPGCWGATVTYSNLSMAGPAIAGVIAMLDGRATEDTLWKERAVPGDSYGDDYGIWYIDVKAVDKSNYKEYDAEIAAQYGLN